MAVKGCSRSAVKEGRKWLIPNDAVRPADGRVSKALNEENMVKLATLEPTEAPSPEPTVW